MNSSVFLFVFLADTSDRPLGTCCSTAKCLMIRTFESIKAGLCELQNNTSNQATFVFLRSVCSAASNSEMKASLMSSLQSRNNSNIMAGLSANQKLILTHLAITAISTEAPEAFNAASQLTS